MEYRPLGRTGMTVSAVSLGTMTFGTQNTQEDGFAQMDRALDAGINFFDTAEMYAVPPTEQSYGKTEEIIGNWFTRSGKRDKVILATKVVGPATDRKYIRGGANRLTRDSINQALDASLKRLQTDYVDYYQVHWPDRPTNTFGRLGYQHQPDAESVPIEETLGALADLVKAGKVRAIGLSNETPWGVMRYLELAREKGWPRVAGIQNPYSLLNRTFEVGLAEMAIREEVGLVCYAPIAGGMLSGKYLDADPPNSRFTLFPDNTRYRKPEAEAPLRKYVALARENGLRPEAMALAYVLSRPFLTSAIVGATSVEQLDLHLEASRLTLSETVLDGIEAIHKTQPNPCP